MRWATRGGQAEGPRSLANGKRVCRLATGGRLRRVTGVTRCRAGSGRPGGECVSEVLVVIRGLVKRELIRPTPGVVGEWNTPPPSSAGERVPGVGAVRPS